MKIALLQLDARLAQPEANSRSIEAAYREALMLGADLAVAPELAVPGYMPGDRLFEPGLRSSMERESQRLRGISGHVPLVFGTCSPADSGKLFNELWWCQQGKLIAKIGKRALADGGAYGEGRYFEPDTCQQKPIEHSGNKIGLALGESPDGPLASLSECGATLIVIAAASTCALGSYVPRGRKPPWALPSKSSWRMGFLSGQSKALGVPVAYINRAGAEDGLLFGGESCLAMPDGTWQCAGSFHESVFMADTEKKGAPWHDECGSEGGWLKKALAAGIKGNLGKQRIEAAVVGLSGGIDSSVVAALAALAVGPERVLGAALPTRFTSPESIRLARLQAQRLGIRYMEIDADATYASAAASLGDALPGRRFGLTDENIQSRCRGMLLMALTSEPSVHELLGTARCAVLSTGNKSEAATGYFTLYGDGVGAMAALGDLLKARVYCLARELGGSIPEEIIARPPTAELKPNQTDESSLMPYRQLDPTLGALLEAGRPQGSIYDDLAEVLEGQDLAEARESLPRILKLVGGSEFKRRQSPFALNVTHHAFGPWRMAPLTAGGASGVQWQKEWARP